MSASASSHQPSAFCSACSTSIDCRIRHSLIYGLREKAPTKTIIRECARAFTVKWLRGASCAPCKTGGGQETMRGSGKRVSPQLRASGGGNAL